MSKCFHIQICIILSVLFTSQIVFAFTFDSLLKDVTESVSQTIDSASGEISETFNELTGNKDKKDLEKQLEEERRKGKALEHKLAQRKSGLNDQDRTSRTMKKGSNRKSKQGSAKGEFADLAGEVDLTSTGSSRPVFGQYSPDRDPSGIFVDLAK